MLSPGYPVIYVLFSFLLITVFIIAGVRLVIQSLSVRESEGGFLKKPFLSYRKFTELSDTAIAPNFLDQRAMMKI